MINHLFGVPIDSNKKLWRALCEIPGIGKKTALSICKELSLLPDELWKNFQEGDKKRLKTWMEENIEISQPLGSEFTRQRRLRRKNIISLGTHRGIRLRLGLPVRGQNTHSNARTSRKIKN